MRKKQGAFPNERYMLINFFLLLSILATNIALVVTNNYKNKTTSKAQLTFYRTQIAATVTNAITVCFMLGLIFKFTMTKRTQKKVGHGDNCTGSSQMSSIDTSQRSEIPAMVLLKNHQALYDLLKAEKDRDKRQKFNLRMQILANQYLHSILNKMEK